MVVPDKIEALINWLVAGAPPRQSFKALVGEMGQRIVGTGLPANQISLHRQLLHPEMPGQFSYWTPTGGSRELTMAADQFQTYEGWVGSAAEECMTSERMVVHTLGTEPRFEANRIVPKQIAHGYTQFVFVPLLSHFSLAASVAGFGTKQAGGFTDAEQMTIRRLQAPLARVVEGYILHEGTVQVLSTYVGRGAGERVLQGNILRGDTEAIPAIVLFADLKGFTKLSNTRPAHDVIERLNLFYNIAETAITRNGGEILKFMGDGLLAIFPTPDDLSAQMAAASGALASLEELDRSLTAESLDELRFRASLHLGDIHYGNIGSKSRLDFTAIGPTVNLAARLMSVADELERDTVCSEAFHHLVPMRTEMLDQRVFKGFEHPHKVFGVAQDAR